MTSIAEAAGGKPEHLTHLYGSELGLVSKSHPRIELRGKLDSLQAKIIEVQLIACKNGKDEIAKELNELLEFARRILACEVKDVPFEFELLIGLTADELRAKSHNPRKYFGIGHIMPSYHMGELVAALNTLRTYAREVELCAVRVFGEQKTDIIRALNRLSSAVYIIICRVVAGDVNEVNVIDEKQVREIVAKVLAREKAEDAKHLVPIEVSARHVHLCKEDVQRLFGADYELTPDRPLSQPGQYLCKERVKLVGPKSEIANVAILGPVRNKTQGEISATDARILGISPPLRMSGNLSGAADILIMAGSQYVEACQSVIIAQSHIHMNVADAKRIGVSDGQCVKVSLNGPRPITFERVAVRVSDDFVYSMHIDFDEANAALFTEGMQGEIISVCHGAPVPMPLSPQNKDVQTQDSQMFDSQEKIITEAIAKDICKSGKRHFSFPKGTIITPLAKDVFNSVKAGYGQ
ncbi:MAG: phosphate propanoyltransferase [Clostridiales bacterium]|jgi:propanediol utilization protein/ethanolamine utilization cobalamin adenosyltransferase|nr:phosphate propanoyltransferase [Clostridiales bacterium]